MSKVVMLRAPVRILHEEAKWVLVKFENGDITWIPKEILK